MPVVLGALLILFGALLLLVLLGLVISGFFAGAASLALSIFAGLDYAFGATALPGAPWLAWLVWGGLIGACLGFWTLAPVYGYRNARPLIIAAPFILLALLTAVRLALRW
jgi:hypothetical protein